MQVPSGREVGAIHRQRPPLTQGSLDGQRNQMRFGLMPLANGGVRVRAGRVEIAQADAAQPMGVVIVGQQLLHQPLGAPIRVDGPLGVTLVDQIGHRFPEDRGGRRKHESLDALRHHGIQQSDRHRQIVGVVLARVCDGLAHLDVGSKVHDRLDRMAAQDAGNQYLITRVADDRFHTRHGVEMPTAQVVEHHHWVTPIAQHTHRVRADVAGTAHDQHAWPLIRTVARLIWGQRHVVYGEFDIVGDGPTDRVP